VLKEHKVPIQVLRELRVMWVTQVLKELKVPIQVLKELRDLKEPQDFLVLKGLPKELKVRQDRQVI
jgi:hypothetical protein